MRVASARRSSSWTAARFATPTTGSGAAGRSSGPGTRPWARGRSSSRSPRIEYLEEERRDGLTQHHVRLEVAPGRTTEDAYLLIPDGDGPFPAVLVVFYEAETGIGRGKPGRLDFALQLARRGFVTLSLGSDPAASYPDKEKPQLQPLSFHAYVAANGYNALANLPRVDAGRIGVLGHSYGGKWAMFASCLYDKFACGVWSDPGIVFDETRPNVNYWEPWYLGWEPGRTRKPGVPTAENPRTGAYRRLDRGRPRPPRAARPDGPAAVPGLGRLGGPAGAVEGTEPRGRGQPAAGLRGPRGDDQPRRATRRRPSRTSRSTASSNTS